MTDLKIVHDATGLRKLIEENPDLPIVVLAGEYPNSGNYGQEYCSVVSCYLDEILDCEIPFGDGIVPTSRDEFEEQLSEYLCDFPEWETLSDDEFDKRLKDEVAKKRKVNIAFGAGLMWLLTG